MLEIRKKGEKHWLFIDNEIGEFTPSKFTINRLNNVITIVYFNNLKSKDYNVSDCYIFDIGDISGFNTSDGVAFMDKLEELNCPCFQKDVTNIYGGGSVESVNGQTGDVILGFSDITTPENLGEFIDGLDSKTDIKDDDEFILSDSEDSLKSKKTRFLDLKTKLKSYFDTFYLSLSVFNDFVTDVFDSLDNKLDKSTTAGVERVYTINPDGSQATKPTSEFNDVLEFADLSSFPENGETGKIYLALDTNFTYRWSGSAYVQIGGGGSDISVLGKKSLPSPVLTGTTSESILETITIPANTLTNGDLLLIRNRVLKSNSNGGFSFRYRISNTNSLVGATQIAFANLTISSFRSQGIERSISVRENSIEVIDPNTSFAYENATTSNANSSFSIDFSQPIYIFITATLTNASDSIVNSNYALLKL